MQIVKTILKIILICIGVLVVIGGISFYWFGLRENAEGEEVANKWMPAIVTSWDADQLITHVSPFAAIVTLDETGKEKVYSGVGKEPQTIKQVFDIARTEFGNMKNFDGVKCKGRLGIICTSTIAFDHASALTMMTLMKRKDGSDEYEIVGFNIMDSRALKSGK